MQNNDSNNSSLSDSRATVAPVCRIQPADVAIACRKTIEELEALAKAPDRLFKPRVRRLVKGKWREIDPPTRLGKATLVHLHRFLQQVCPPGKIVHGGALKRSCFTSASLHCGRSLVVTRDIFRCYPSITQSMIFGALIARGFRSDTAALLADLLVIRGCVPQGSPASGSALNILLFEFDKQLRETCETNSWRASRTYDDIVVSSMNLADRPAIERFLNDSIARVGLEFSHRKAKRRGVQVLRGHDGKRTEIHSLVTSRAGGVKIGAKHHQEAIAIATRYQNCCKALSASSLLAAAKLRQQAVGWKHYSGQARFGPYRNVKQLIESGDRIASRRLNALGIAEGPRPWFALDGGHNEPRRLMSAWNRKNKTQSMSA